MTTPLAVNRGGGDESLLGGAGSDTTNSGPAPTSVKAGTTTARMASR